MVISLGQQTSTNMILRRPANCGYEVKAEIYSIPRGLPLAKIDLPKPIFGELGTRILNCMAENMNMPLPSLKENLEEYFQDGHTIAVKMCFDDVNDLNSVASIQIDGLITPAVIKRVSPWESWALTRDKRQLIIPQTLFHGAVPNEENECRLAVPWSFRKLTCVPATAVYPTIIPELHYPDETYCVPLL